MLSFCTLFDTNYMARGLALYRSLEKVCPAFHLYVFAFDDNCYQYLNNHQLKNLTVISLHEFESKSLLEVKPTRSPAEYCWTSTPWTILYCLEHFNLEHCTYLDADMIFYYNPQVLIDEMGNKSVLISEHRYTPEYDQSWYSGIYCVQFMCFKNNADGLEVLNWWKDRCIEWCYARHEDGKFGDQKYLDDWPTRFDTVHVMQHPGGGIAPWNLDQYFFSRNESGWFIRALKDDVEYPVIFFHYHGVKFYKDSKVLLAGPLYLINPNVKQLFYFSYIEELVQTAEIINQTNPSLNANGAHAWPPSNISLFLKFIADKLKSFRHYFPAAFHLKNYNFKLHNHLYPLNKFE